MESVKTQEKELKEPSIELPNPVIENPELSLVGTIRDLEREKDRLPGKLLEMNKLLEDFTKPIGSAMDYTLALTKLEEYLKIFEWINNLNIKISEIARDKYYISSYLVEDKFKEAKDIVNIRRESNYNKLKDYENENPNWIKTKQELDLALDTGIQSLDERIKEESGPMGILKMFPGKNKKVNSRTALKEFYKKLKEENNNIKIQKPGAIKKIDDLLDEFRRQDKDILDYYSNSDEIGKILNKERDIIKSNSQLQSRYEGEVQDIENKFSRFKFIQENLNKNSETMIEYANYACKVLKTEEEFTFNLYKEQAPITKAVFLERKNLMYDVANKIKIEKLENLSKLNLENPSAPEVRQWMHEIIEIIYNLESAYVFGGINFEEERQLAEIVEGALLVSDKDTIEKLKRIKENFNQQVVDKKEKNLSSDDFEKYKIEFTRFVKLLEDVPMKDETELQTWLEKPIKRFSGNLFTHVSGEKSFDDIVSSGFLVSKSLLNEDQRERGMNNNDEENKIYFDTNNISAVYGGGRSFDYTIKRIWFCMTGEDVINADLSAQYKLFFWPYKFEGKHDANGEPLISMKWKDFDGSKIPLENVSILLPDDMDKKFIENINLNKDKVKTIGTFNNNFYEPTYNNGFNVTKSKKEDIKIEEIRRINNLIRKNEDETLPKIAISAVPIFSKDNNSTLVNNENAFNSNIEPFSFVTFVKLKELNK